MGTISVYKIGFVIEQALGHITHTKNLQANIPADPSVAATWGLIPWETSGLGAHVPVYRTNWTVRAGIRARHTVARMMRDAAPDVFFFHTQVPAVLATSWLRRVPSVVSLDATPLQYDALGHAYQHARGPAWLEHQKWKLNRDCFAAARSLVTWSEWARQGLIADYEVPAEKIEVIPPGVNTAEWRRSTPRTAHDGPVKILFVGGDFERKGGTLLLEAFRTLQPLGAELHLVTRSQLPPTPGVVVYRDLQPNSAALKQLYHDCHIFCLPTDGDCLPMVLSEAGAAGLPAVSTRLASIPEIVRDRETGFLIEPGDAAALTVALRRLVEQPALRLTMGGCAVAHVQRAYDAPTNTRRLLSQLKSVADRARVAKVAA